jgi:hypothetical protein
MSICTVFLVIFSVKRTFPFIFGVLKTAMARMFDILGFGFEFWFWFENN